MHVIRLISKMEKCGKTIILCLTVLFAAVQLLQAEPAPYKQSKYIWSKKVNKYTGRYANRRSLAPSLTFSADALYYYGDIDNRAYTFKNGFNTGNVGFMANLNYSHPLGTSGVNMRFTLGGGMLRGDGEGGTKHIESLMRKGCNFQSGMGRMAVGAEWYPVADYGFYMYAGLSFAYSRVKFNYANGDFVLTDKTSDCFALMVPIEIGYNWLVNTSWIIGVHAGIATCVIPENVTSSVNLNLDAYPNVEYKIGTSQENKSIDGWFQIGVTIGYSWHEMRNSNNRKK